MPITCTLNHLPCCIFLFFSIFLLLDCFFPTYFLLTLHSSSVSILWIVFNLLWHSLPESLISCTLHIYIYFLINLIFNSRIYFFLFLIYHFPVLSFNILSWSLFFKAVRIFFLLSLYQIISLSRATDSIVSSSFADFNSCYSYIYVSHFLIFVVNSLDKNKHLRKRITLSSSGDNFSWLILRWLKMWYYYGQTSELEFLKI